MIATPIGDSANIEFFEIKGTTPGVRGIGALGLQHFAVYCDDIAEVLRRVLAAGGTQLRGPNPMFTLEEGRATQRITSGHHRVHRSS